MKKTQNKIKTTLHDFLIESLQNYWYISLIPNKYVKPSRNYDISAGNIREITPKYVSIKYYRYYIIPSFIKINFVDIDVIRRFVKRKKSLTNIEVLSLNGRKSVISKKQAKLAALFKWGFLFLVMLVVAVIAVGIALAVTYIKK